MIKKTWRLFNNYFLARLLNRPSTAQFWYLPEPVAVRSSADLTHYQSLSPSAPYLIDYRRKLDYQLMNHDGIIVLPYDPPIGPQINPEAAFQYALGLHDTFLTTKDDAYRQQFFYYANYFLTRQTSDGLFTYDFPWHGSKAPWASALAQTRGAAVMLRAWQLSRDNLYLQVAKQAVNRLAISTQAGGFLHHFALAKCDYFEEYPLTPTGVINGFMASLISLWELAYWTNKAIFIDLWNKGLPSLEAMLPYYRNTWWSLYDLDESTPIANVNSPRYHLLEINYLQLLALLSGSVIIQEELTKRQAQYQRLWTRGRAYAHKLTRKLLYK